MHLRLTLLILEGYLYLALIVGSFLLPVGLLVWGVLTLRPFAAIVAVLVGIPVVVTSIRAMRALWLGFPRVEGVDIGPHVGGRLHQTVAEIARRVRAPRVHRIVVTDSNNASMLRARSRGLWPVNTLMIGYPLLATLSAEQIGAVVVHELAHLTHAHGRFTGWVYRTRLQWNSLMEVLHRHQSVPIHVHLLFRFYVPRLRRHAADVSRQQERLADRLAADVAGAEVTAQALVAIEVAHYVLERMFWPRVFDRLQHEPEPPNPFREMGPDIWSSAERKTQLLDELLAGVTGDADSHPSLRERLANIGHSPRWPDLPASTAADDLLGDDKEAIVEAVGEPWRAARLTWWRARHEEVRTRRTRLAELAALASPTPGEKFERGELLERDGRDDEAIELYRSAFADGHPRAGLAAGRILLEREDDRGIALITAAMDAVADPHGFRLQAEGHDLVIEEGCEAIVEFLERRGRRADAYRYEARLTRHTAATRMARQERAQLSVVDRFGPRAEYGMDVVALAAALRRRSEVLRAFLVTRELRYSPGTQTVLAVFVSNGAAADLPQEIERIGGPGDLRVFQLGAHERALEAALREVPGALIYGKEIR